MSLKTAWYMLQKIRTLYKQDNATALRVSWSATRCISAERRNGSTRVCAHHARKGAALRPKRLCSE